MGLGTNKRYTPVSQSGVSGQGTAASPFKVTTVAVAGRSGVRISQVDSYVIGQESYRSDVTIINTGRVPVGGHPVPRRRLLHAGLRHGLRVRRRAARAVGCAANAENKPAARIVQWYPITGASQYMEGRYAEIWTNIVSHQPFPNTTRATEAVDNGAGISWSFALSRGAQATYSHHTIFSPRGVAGPRPRNTPPAPVGGVRAQGTARDAVQRPLRQPSLLPHPAAQEVLAGDRERQRGLRGKTRVLRRPPWGTIADLRGLRRAASRFGSRRARRPAARSGGRASTAVRRQAGWQQAEAVGAAVRLRARGRLFRPIWRPFLAYARVELS